jgi:hypothetical protein
MRLSFTYGRAWNPNHRPVADGQGPRTSEAPALDSSCGCGECVRKWPTPIAFAVVTGLRWTVCKAVPWRLWFSCLEQPVLYAQMTNAGCAVHSANGGFVRAYAMKSCHTQ